MSQGSAVYSKIAVQDEVRFTPHRTTSFPLRHITQYASYIGQFNFPVILLAIAENCLVVSATVFTGAIYANELLSIRLHLGSHGSDNVLPRHLAQMQTGTLTRLPQLSTPARASSVTCIQSSWNTYQTQGVSLSTLTHQLIVHPHRSWRLKLSTGVLLRLSTCLATRSRRPTRGGCVVPAGGWGSCVVR
jgi:hypothetical protein